MAVILPPAAQREKPRMKHMKLWGWGEEGMVFRNDEKPALAGFFKEAINLDVSQPPVAVMDFRSVTLPPSSLPASLRESLEFLLGSDYVKNDALARIVHAYGKSLRD